MEYAHLQGLFTGTGVAVITPMTADQKIDFRALELLIDRLIQGKVEYLVFLGTTAETPVLSNEEKKDILTCVYDKVAGRCPIMVGVGGNDTADLVNDLTHFPLDKADAILSASPYYNKPSQEGIYQHYKVIAAASPKPIMLYNVPGRTGKNMLASTTLRIAHEVPNVFGIKEASGDFTQCIQILKDKPKDFIVVSGDDALALPQMACGMRGVISVAANAYPLLFSSMVRACLDSDFATAKLINDKLIEAYSLMFEENNPAGVKGFMANRNWVQLALRLPNVPVSADLFARITKLERALPDVL